MTIKIGPPCNNQLTISASLHFHQTLVLLFQILLSISLLLGPPFYSLSLLCIELCYLSIRPEGSIWGERNHFSFSFYFFNSNIFALRYL